MLPPVGGGRPGGALTVEDGQQTYVVDRHIVHQDEDLAVSDAQGKRREGRPLALLTRWRR